MTNRTVYRRLLTELRDALHERHTSRLAWRHCHELGFAAMQKRGDVPVGAQFKYLTDDLFAESFFVDLLARVETELKGGMR